MDMEELFLTLKTTNMKIFVVVYITSTQCNGLVIECERPVNSTSGQSCLPFYDNNARTDMIVNRQNAPDIQTLPNPSRLGTTFSFQNIF